MGWTCPTWIAPYRRPLTGPQLLHAIPAATAEDLATELLGDPGRPGDQRAPCGALLEVAALWWRAHPAMLTDASWPACTACRAQLGGGPSGTLVVAEGSSPRK